MHSATACDSLHCPSSCPRLEERQPSEKNGISRQPSINIASSFKHKTVEFIKPKARTEAAFKSSSFAYSNKIWLPLRFSVA